MRFEPPGVTPIHSRRRRSRSVTRRGRFTSSDPRVRANLLIISTLRCRPTLYLFSSISGLTKLPIFEHSTPTRHRTLTMSVYPPVSVAQAPTSQQCPRIDDGLGYLVIVVRVVIWPFRKVLVAGSIGLCSRKARSPSSGASVSS
ncbi:hypothetical protein BDV10DRAFT_62618 [Aspergillus recurvatus]